MEERIIKFYAKESNILALHAIQGHFATTNSHVNYYVDVSGIRSRMREAEEAARILAGKLGNLNYVDTVVCMDDTEVIGAFLAKEFSREHIASTNRHKSVYVLSPEQSRDNQMIFRDNTKHMVTGKHIILLLATTTTGETIRKSIKGLKYYGGVIEGAASVFSTVKMMDGIKIQSIFNENDVHGYQAYPKADCPICAQGIKIDAVVNGFGYSKL
ncbi:MAG: orotate phosphoribosyltransferase [Eubacterium sp.]|nr:orotate phosphoribosyltransferase [Eubacterium sp.]